MVIDDTRYFHFRAALQVPEDGWEHSLNIVIIDYLQLMSGSSRRAVTTYSRRISRISRSLKALAVDSIRARWCVPSCPAPGGPITDHRPDRFRIP